MTKQQIIDQTRDSARRSLNEIMGRFDFQKAALILAACDWKYEGTDLPPSEAELRGTSKKIVMDILDSTDVRSIRSGPLQVRRYHYGVPFCASVELELKPVWGSTVFLDFRLYSPTAHDAAEQEGK